MTVSLDFGNKIENSLIDNPKKLAMELIYMPQ